MRELEQSGELDEAEQTGIWEAGGRMGVRGGDANRWVEGPGVRSPST